MNNYCSDDFPGENTDSGYEGGGRKSMDKTVSTFGSKLLELTSVSHNWSSVNDYFIASLTPSQKCPRLKLHHV